MTRKKFWQFHVEQKSLRSLFGPTLYTVQRRQGVKCGIDFNEIEVLRVPPKAIRRGQAFRIPILDKSGIGPTRCADANFAHIRGHGPDNCFIWLRMKLRMNSISLGEIPASARFTEMAENHTSSTGR